MKKAVGAVGGQQTVLMKVSASGGACGAGFEFYMMGALRCDSRDARTCIENRFHILAGFC